MLSHLPKVIQELSGGHRFNPDLSDFQRRWTIQKFMGLSPKEVFFFFFFQEFWPLESHTKDVLFLRHAMTQIVTISLIESPSAESDINMGQLAALHRTRAQGCSANIVSGRARFRDSYHKCFAIHISSNSIHFAE